MAIIHTLMGFILLGMGSIPIAMPTFTHCGMPRVLAQGAAERGNFAYNRERRQPFTPRLVFGFVLKL